MKEPKLRVGTRAAIETLAQELELPYDASMQDWSCEVANFGDMEKYIEYYKVTSDPDQKFVLMQIIMQAMNDQIERKEVNKHWQIVKETLIMDFAIHEYTIFYWSCFNSQNIEGTWPITLRTREIWHVMGKAG